METTTQMPDGTESTSRRALLTALVTGGALATGAATLVAAGTATAEGSGTAPLRDPADNAALNAALLDERATVAAYAAAVGSSALSADQRSLMQVFHDHHRAYVDALKAFLGPAATSSSPGSSTTSNQSFAELATALARDERRHVETHSKTIGTLAGTEAAALLASIIIIEARHAEALTVLAASAGA